MMNINQVLSSLLEGLNYSGEALTVNQDTMQHWPQGTVALLLKTGLLTKTAAAQSVECHGCEKGCLSEVLISKENGKDHRAFIVCEEPEMQQQMGRIDINPERLKQWKISAKQIANVIATLLDIDKLPDTHSKENLIPIGMLTGKKGRRLICLLTNPLSLEINRHAVPLNELLFFEGNNLTLDRDRINALINDDSQSKAKRYQPSSDKRALSKFKTQAMYQDWNDAWLKLKKKNPDKSDTWCAKQIAKMDVAQNRSFETIRRNMK